MYSIYLIVNKVNNKVYVGQTKDTIEKRFEQHIKSSRRSKLVLARAIRKYGIDAFTISLIETASSKKAANEAEIRNIELYDSNNPMVGYNLTKGGDGGDTFSAQTEDRKAAIRQESRDRALLNKPWETKWNSEESKTDHSKALKKMYADKKAKGIEIPQVAAMQTSASKAKRKTSMAKTFKPGSTASVDRGKAIAKTKSKPENRKKLSDSTKGHKNANSRTTIIYGKTFSTRKEAAEYFGISEDKVLKLHRQGLIDNNNQTKQPQ